MDNNRLKQTQEEWMYLWIQEETRINPQELLLQEHMQTSLGPCVPYFTAVKWI